MRQINRQFPQLLWYLVFVNLDLEDMDFCNTQLINTRKEKCKAQAE